MYYGIKLKNKIISQPEIIFLLSWEGKSALLHKVCKLSTPLHQNSESCDYKNFSSVFVEQWISQKKGGGKEVVVVQVYL